jgi:hypothetical protein
MGTGLTGRLVKHWVSIAAVVVVMPACSGSSTPATSPTSSTTRTTETFTGTVAIGGHDLHSFPVATTGAVDVTLTAAAPPADVVMAISIGLPVNGLCTPMAGASAQTAAGTSVQLSGISSPATLCVDVHDAGGQTAPVTYGVTVVHP